jgi:hypothetical protein
LGLLGNLELNRPLGFLLHDRRPAGDVLPVANVANSCRKLKVDPNRPDFLASEV